MVVPHPQPCLKTWQNCIDHLQDIYGPTVTICCGAHCVGMQVSTTYHSICLCTNWKNQPIPNCDPKNTVLSPVPSQECFNSTTGMADDNLSQDECNRLHQQDANWSYRSCFCCCACLARGTMIAIPDGSVPVEEIQIGNRVLAASVTPGSGGIGLTWEQQTVTFSAGTGPDTSETALIGVAYGDGLTLVTTRDQLFLLPTGKLKRADKLVPGQDALVLHDGSSTPIHEIVVGAHAGGLHHIATDAPGQDDPQISANGHLLSADGVIVGDFFLQVYQDVEPYKSLLVDGHEELPVLGTPAYQARYGNVAASAHAARSPALMAAAAPGTTNGTGAEPPSLLAARPDFQPYTGRQSRIPDDAQTFVSTHQAADIQGSAPHRPLANSVGTQTINYLFKVYGAFYPDIRFYLDWDDGRTNAFSFTEFGQKFVVVAGGLVRLQDLYFEGHAIILAHEIGHLLGGDPSDENGYACEGQADYFGIGVVMRTVWFGNFWSTIIEPGIPQIEKYFSYITDDNKSPKDKQGNPLDVCHYPTIDCRLSAMQAAIGATADLPPCAGGPTPNGLHLVGASATGTNGASQVLATFNEKLSTFNAGLTSNFELTPPAPISSARIATNPSQVTLAASLAPGTSYQLTAANLYADDGSTLDPAQSTASFTSPGEAGGGGGGGTGNGAATGDGSETGSSTRPAGTPG